MKLLLLPLVFCLVQAGPVDLPTATFGFGSSAIINGQDANIEDFPWQLSLLFLNGHTCGAILASETMALTAAHCVNGRNYNNFQIKAGMESRNELASLHQLVEIDTIVEHEDYTSAGGYPNDIALITFESAVTLNNNVQPIALATGSELWTGRECQVSGWGRDSDSQLLPQRLQYTDTNVISNAECDDPGMNGVIGATILDSHICIFNGESGVCNGDSGGPMNCRLSSGGMWYDTGVTSWVVSSGGNCLVTYPQVYTRVSSHEDWISSTSGGALP